MRVTKKTIKGVTEDMNRFRFNTAISKLMVLTNEMRTTLDAGGAASGETEILRISDFYDLIPGNFDRGCF